MKETVQKKSRKAGRDRISGVSGKIEHRRCKKWRIVMDYKNAGVDIEAGYKSVELMKEHVKKNNASGSTRWTGWIFRCVFSCKDQRDGRAGTAFRNRRMRNKSQTGNDHGQA